MSDPGRPPQAGDHSGSQPDISAYPRSSRLAAGSLGFGAALVLGHLIAWAVGSRIGSRAPAGDPLALAVGLTFYLAVLMTPVALGLGIAAKIRRGQPGWWSTAGLILAGIGTLILLIDLWMAAVVSG